MEVRSVEAIVSALNKAEAKYLIVRGLAVNAHGFVRLTRNVDIVPSARPSQREQGFERLIQHRVSNVYTGTTARFRKSGNEGGVASGQRHDHSETLE